MRFTTVCEANFKMKIDCVPLGIFESEKGETWPRKKLPVLGRNTEHSVQKVGLTGAHSIAVFRCIPLCSVVSRRVFRCVLLSLLKHPLCSLEHSAALTETYAEPYPTLSFWSLTCVVIPSDLAFYPFGRKSLSV